MGTETCWRSSSPRHSSPEWPGDGVLRSPGKGPLWSARVSVHRLSRRNSVVRPRVEPRRWKVEAPRPVESIKDLGQVLRTQLKEYPTNLSNFHLRR